MLESLDTLAPFAIPLSVVVGLLIGSFLNVVIYRVPVMMERGWTQFAKEHLQLELTEEEQQPFNLMKPDSRCPKCHAPVKAWQNIPIFSYLMLGGKCGSCKTPISIRYPLIELLTGILFGCCGVAIWLDDGCIWQFDIDCNIDCINLYRCGYSIFTRQPDPAVDMVRFAV